METWKVLINAIHEFYFPKLKETSLEEFLETMWKITTILPTAFSLAKESGEGRECRKEIGKLICATIRNERRKKLL